MSDEPRPVRLGWWLSSEEHDPRHLVRQAAMAEQVGFTTAMISDHLQPWIRRQGQAPHVWTVIGGIASLTDALEVGTGVVAFVHRNHPIVVAQAAATAAVMLEDRFFLGVGVGERLNEQAFAERWPRVGERRDDTIEAIDVIRRLWSGQPVNHRGAQWAVENLRLTTLPASPPPIYMAAAGKLSAAAAGEHADGMIGVQPDAHLVDVFCGSGGTGKPCLGQLHVSLASTVDEAMDTAWEWWPNAAVPPQLLGELARPEEFESIAQALTADKLSGTVTIATSADAIVTAINRFIAAGYDTVYLHQIGPDQQRLADLAKSDLLPHYRRA